MSVFRLGLAWLWALPLTMLGLPLWLMQRWAVSQSLQDQHSSSQLGAAQLRATALGWVLTANGPVIAKCLKHHPFGAMHAVALGCCVFASDALALDTHFSHELVHVQQAQQWGLFFPLAYLISSA